MPVIDPWSGMKQSTNVLANMYSQKQAQQQNALNNQYRDRTLANQEQQNAFSRQMQQKQADIAGRQEDRLTEKEKLASDLQKLQLFGKVMTGITDDQTLQAGKKLVAERYGPELVQGVPDTYAEFDKYRQQQLPIIKSLFDDGKKEYDRLTLYDKEGRATGSVSVEKGVDYTPPTEGQYLNAPPKDTGAPRIGSTRTFQEGDKTITEEYTEKGWAKKAEGPKWNETDSMSYSQREGEIVSKWLSDQELSEKEQEVLNKRLKDKGKTPADVKADAKARIAAKVESYKELMGKEPSPDEKRSMIINDPWGFLASSETNEYQVGQVVNVPNKGLHKYLGDGKWQKQ